MDGYNYLYFLFLEPPWRLMGWAWATEYVLNVNFNWVRVSRLVSTVLRTLRY